MLNPNHERPEFEGPTKSPEAKMVQGCLLLILFTVIVGSGLVVVISLMSTLWGKK